MFIFYDRIHFRKRKIFHYVSEAKAEHDTKAVLNEPSQVTCTKTYQNSSTYAFAFKGKNKGNMLATFTQSKTIFNTDIVSIID